MTSFIFNNRRLLALKCMHCAQRIYLRFADKLLYSHFNVLRCQYFTELGQKHRFLTPTSDRHHFVVSILRRLNKNFRSVTIQCVASSYNTNPVGKNIYIFIFSTTKEIYVSTETVSETKTSSSLETEAIFQAETGLQTKTCLETEASMEADAEACLQTKTNLETKAFLQTKP